MLKLILVLLTSITFIGCQSIKVKPVFYQGFIEKITKPFQINITPTEQFKYITRADGEATYAKESIHRAGSLLIKTSQVSFKEGSGDLISTISSNGLLQRLELKNLKLNSNIDTKYIEQYTQIFLNETENSALIAATRRHPDYALGQDLYEGFTSQCYREEIIVESALSIIMNQQLNLPKSEIKLNSNSECNLLGYTYIQGRKSAVFSENIQSSIAKKGHKELAQFSLIGWKAVDLEKGLIIENFHKLNLYVNGKKIDDYDIDSSIRLISLK